MPVDLSDYVDSLRREVTPPGNDIFDGVDDLVFTGYLTDAFWEARLDGFLTRWSADLEGIVTPVSGTEEIPRELIGLVILYAGIKILRNRIMNLNTSFRSKAGPVEYEVQNSANLLTEMLKQLAARKDSLLEEARQVSTPTFYVDAYAVRGHSPGSYWGHETSSYLASLAN